MKKRKRIIIVSLSGAIVIICLILMVIIIDWRNINGLIYLGNHEKLKGDIVTTEETAMKIALSLIKEHLPDICENGEYKGKLHVSDEIEYWLILTSGVHGGDMAAKISKKNGKVLMLIIEKGLFKRYTIR